MAVFWKQDLDGLGQHVEPPIGPLNPMQLMRAAPVEATIRAQDHVVAMSRRIVASGGVGGSETWETPDSDPTVSAGTHPTPTGRRRIGAGSFDLTPGCFLRCWVAAVPSGQTQITGTTPGGAQGRLEIDVSWTDGTGTVSTEHGVQLVASTEDDGAQPTVWWNDLHSYTVIDIRPAALGDTETLRRWCQHVNADVRIYAVGGARVVDAVVFEWPLAAAFEADDDGEQWTSHLYAPGSPAGPGLPLAYPYQRFSETTPDGDPRGGTLHMMDVHSAQHMRLGPMLFSWSAHEEATGGETVSVSSSTWLPLLGGATTYDRDEPSLCVDTGGYARRHASNGPFVLRNRRSAIPVIVRVLATSSSGVAEARVQTNDWSWVDVPISNGGIAWHSAAGWLEVGTNPDQIRHAQIFAQNSLAASVSVAAVNVYYAGGYTPHA